MNNYKKLIPRVSAHLTVLFDKFWSIPIKTRDPSTSISFVYLLSTEC